MRTAICPGSFDPITLGHLDIIRRASLMFDEVVVVILENAGKNSHMFSVEERVGMIERACAGIPNVRADSDRCLLAEYVKRFPGGTVVKGLRTASDFEYEFQMALANRHMNPDMETVFLVSDSRYNFISSSLVRELAAYGADISGYVPDEIIDEIYEKSGKRR